MPYLRQKVGLLAAPDYEAVWHDHISVAPVKHGAVEGAVEEVEVVVEVFVGSRRRLEAERDPGLPGVAGLERRQLQGPLRQKPDVNEHGVRAPYLAKDLR